MMTRNLLLLSSLLLLAACGDPPPAPEGDNALNGTGEGATLAAATVRPVWVGRNENPRANACTNRVQLRGESATARWSPAADSPVKATISEEVLACDREGAWTGIVFAGHGESLDYCNLNRRIRFATEYQGPCRSGWVLTSELAG
jgi:hypothetical protein